MYVVYILLYESYVYFLYTCVYKLYMRMCAYDLRESYSILTVAYIDNDVDKTYCRPYE